MTTHIRDYQGKHIHFIGIGGCSMSGLAQLLRRQGYEITGSDRDRSHKTDALAAGGMKVSIGHDAKNVEGADLIVFTAAIPEGNPERVRARESGIPEVERAQLLGQLMEGYGHAIGISGTHGKTTATAMLAQVCMEAGLSPTAHFGGELDAVGGSTILGEKDVFVVEACEFAGSFLKFHPTIAVILNIDEDHLDFYKDIDHIEQAFAQFAALTPADGWCVACGDDERALRVMKASGRAGLSFGLGAGSDVRAEQISYDELGRARCMVTLRGHQLMELELSVPGEHNLRDALSAIAVACILELPMRQVSESLGRFTGAHRRFELTSVTDGVKVYTDYGHNPTETRNALRIASCQPHGTLWAVLQPHTYSRTKKLFDAWMHCWEDADKVVVTDICAAREADPGDIHSRMLVDAMVSRGIDAVLTPGFDDAEAYLRKHWREGDLVITLGCGNIDLLNEQIREHGDTR